MSQSFQTKNSRRRPPCQVVDKPANHERVSVQIMNASLGEIRARSRIVPAWPGE